MNQEQGGNCERERDAYRWAARVPLSTPLARNVLLIMVDHCDAEGRCSLTHAEIAEKAMISTRQLTRELALMGSIIDRVREGDIGNGRKPDKLLVRIPGSIAASVAAIAPTVADYMSASVADNLASTVTANLAAIVTVEATQSAIVKDNLAATAPQSPHAHTRVVTSSSSISRELEPSTELNSPTPQPRANGLGVWAERHEAAVQALNGAANMTSGGMHHVAALKALCEPASGKPCDFEADVLPALIEIGVELHAKNDKLSHFNHPGIKRKAERNRDLRLAGNSEVTHAERDPSLFSPASTAPRTAPNGNGRGGRSLSAKAREYEARCAAVEAERDVRVIDITPGNVI